MKKILFIGIIIFLINRPSVIAQPYIGEIQIFAGNFATEDWAICDGSLLEITEYSALYALIGTTYGGDGINTFALPDLRGRIPIHQGQGNGLTNKVIGEMGGTENVTLTANQMPQHVHEQTLTLPVNSGLGDQNTPEGNYLSVNPARTNGFSSNVSNATMGTVLNVSGSTAPTGGNQGHENRMPYLSVNYIIALNGIFPSY